MTEFFLPQLAHWVLLRSEAVGRRMVPERRRSCARVVKHDEGEGLAGLSRTGPVEEQVQVQELELGGETLYGREERYCSCSCRIELGPWQACAHSSSRPVGRRVSAKDRLCWLRQEPDVPDPPQ